MEEIKCRAWDKSKNEWVSCGLWHELRGSKEGPIYFGLYSYSHDVDIMMYTGLKDKNGKEIYEGDIVTQVAMNIVTGIIKYYAPEWKLKSIHSGMNFVLSHRPYALEVIGNIYQNPELLKVENV